MTVATKEVNAELLRVSKDAVRVLDEIARTLDRWAVESRYGGWSTHQVDANIHVANDCRREADLIARVIEKADRGL